MLLAAGAFALAACAAVTPALPEDPARELAGVPFFPQTMHQCGPAALATVLGASGVAATPEELAPQVYIPGRKGSLALELVAAARRAGRIPYEVGPGEAALSAELAAGTPVLVLQDFGIGSWRAWHFAVVVGIDTQRELVVLRSGAERRRLERRSHFLRSWERGDRWALVTLPPEQLPASLEPDAVVRTVEQARDFLPPGATGRAYDAALARWPSDPNVLFAAANEAYSSGRMAEAEARYRRLLAESPAHVAGRNNLANLLLERGCPAAAAAEAGRALADLAAAPGGQARHGGAVEDTRRRALAATGPGAVADSGCP